MSNNESHCSDAGMGAQGEPRGAHSSESCVSHSKRRNGCRAFPKQWMLLLLLMSLKSCSAPHSIQIIASQCGFVGYTF